MKAGSIKQAMLPNVAPINERNRPNFGIAIARVPNAW